MAFTYGFYDALDYDRRYAAKDFGDLISMLVTDGVMENYGQKFFTTVGTGMDVNVGTGKAWFDNTWSTNDSIMVVSLPQSDITRPRYDAIVLEVNEEIAVRANSIKVISGAPQVTPTKPTLTNTETVHQHPLAYILVPAAATAITASDIEIVVGRSDCPFATSILQKTDITDLYNKWENDFQTWFNNLKDQLTSNVVTNLQGQINSLREESVKYSDAATSAEVLAGTDEKKYVTPKSLDGVLGVVKDENDGRVVKLYGELVGFTVYPAYADLTSPNLTGVFHQWYYPQNMVYDSTRKRIYLLRYYQVSSGSSPIYDLCCIPATKLEGALTPQVVASNMNAKFQYESASSFRIANITQCARNTSIGFTMATSGSSSSYYGCYDTENGSVSFTDRYTWPTGNNTYWLVLRVDSAQVQFIYRLKSASITTNTSVIYFLSNVSTALMLGIYNNEVWYAASTTSNKITSTLIYVFTLGTTLNNVNPLGIPVTSNSEWIEPLHYNSSTIYAKIRDDTGVRSKVLVIDMISKTSNYAEASKSPYIDTGNFGTMYIGTMGEKNYYVTSNQMLLSFSNDYTITLKSIRMHANNVNPFNMFGIFSHNVLYEVTLNPRDWGTRYVTRGGILFDSETGDAYLFDGYEYGNRVSTPYYGGPKIATYSPPYTIFANGSGDIAPGVVMSTLGTQYEYGSDIGVKAIARSNIGALNSSIYRFIGSEPVYHYISKGWES